MKWVVVVENIGLNGWGRYIYVEKTQKDAEITADNYGNHMDKKKVKVVDVLRYDKYIEKYGIDDIKDNIVNLHVADYKTRECLYSYYFDKMYGKTEDGEILIFGRPVRNTEASINEAYFKVVWSSEVMNKEQWVLVEQLPNSGKIEFSRELNTRITTAMKTMVEIERTLELVGKKDALATMQKTHKLMESFLAN